MGTVQDRTASLGHFMNIFKEKLSSLDRLYKVSDMKTGNPAAEGTYGPAQDHICYGFLY